MSTQDNNPFATGGAPQPGASPSSAPSPAPAAPPAAAPASAPEASPYTAPRATLENNAAPSAEEKQWALFAHLAALIGFVIPFGNVAGPLVVWLIKKDTMPFVDDQGKEALNFQITVFIAALVCFVLIGIVLIFIVGLAALVLTIIGGIKANEGQRYRYPLTIRLIK
jgi:uncharacterized protein